MTLPPAVAERLGANFGLDLATLGAGAVAAAWRHRREAAGAPSDVAYQRVLNGSATELAALAEELLVPESWFFRDRAPFAFLESWAQRQWLPQHAGGVLRVLSVPCAAGQEPYSIAMTLLDAGLRANQFLVWAGDVSERILELARAGEYSATSFRGRDAAGRDHHFEPRPNGRRRVRAAVRATVQFHHCNLMDPELARGEPPFDAVFCRNVLIYFDTAARARVLANLRRCLAPDGVLFAGHADSLSMLDPGFAAVGPTGSFAFQRRAPATPAPARPPVARRRPGKTRSPHRAAAAAPPAAPPPPPAPASAATLLAEARRLADAGELDTADAVCREIVREHGPQAEAYFLLGQLAAARGRTGEAEPLYRKALYLDAHHREALLQLALLSERRGDPAAAARLRQRIRAA